MSIQITQLAYKQKYLKSIRNYISKQKKGFVLKTHLIFCGVGFRQGSSYDVDQDNTKSLSEYEFENILCNNMYLQLS